MVTVTRFPNVTIVESESEDNEAVKNALVQLEHMMRDRFPDEGIDKIAYRSKKRKITLITLQAHAPLYEIDINFRQDRLTLKNELVFKEIALLGDYVAQALPELLEANKIGREKDILLGRKTDKEGNVITDVKHWKFDPLFEPIARSLGFDPKAPIRLMPSVYETDTINGAKIAPTRKENVVLYGYVCEDNLVDISFGFDEGLIQTFELTPDSVDISIRGDLPETMMASLKDRPISDLIGFDGVPVEMLQRKIDRIGMVENTKYIFAEAKPFVHIT